MFSEICTQSPRRKARLFALSFLENKGVENIVRFAPGGPGAGETTILEFAMIPHQIFFLNYVCQLLQFTFCKSKEACGSAAAAECFDNTTFKKWRESIEFQTIIN